MFKFELKSKARIAVSGEGGEIIGRGEYANGAPSSYLIRYRDAMGVAREEWFSEDALEESPNGFGLLTSLPKVST